MKVRRKRGLSATSRMLIWLILLLFIVLLALGVYNLQNGVGATTDPAWATGDALYLEARTLVYATVQAQTQMTVSP